MDTQVHKTVNFTPELMALIKAGEKRTTWRLWDEKNLSLGDTVALLCKPNPTPFAMARIVSATEKTLSEVTEEDFEGHEKYASKEEMYATYEKHYNRPVGPDTPVKIIHFELIS